MDSDRFDKVAKLAGIGSFILGLVWFAYEVWSDYSAKIDPSLPTLSYREALMNRWLPSAIIGGCVLLAAFLHLVAVLKRRRIKRLTGEVAQLQGKIGNLNETLETAKASANQLQSNNNVLEDDLKTSRMKIEKLESLQTELKTANNGLASRIEALEPELLESQREAEQANARANSEAIQQANSTNRVNELEREQAIWEPILKHARYQAAQIDEWVRVKKTIPGKMLTQRMVTFEIRIHNNSLYPISIRPKDIKGKLRFKTEPLSEEIQTVPDEPAIKDLEPGAPAILKLQQPLRIFEAEKVREAHELRDNDALFWLGDLYIPISAKDTPVPVRALPLVIIPKYISLDVNDFSYR